MRKLLLLAALACLPSFGHADTLQHFVFAASNALSSAAGDLTIDTTTGTLVGGDVVVTVFHHDPPDPGSYEFSQNPFTGHALDTNALVTTLGLSDGGVNGVTIGIRLPDLVGYEGGFVCVAEPPVGQSCYDGRSAYLALATDHPFTQASLEPVPEPTTFALLGTGLLGAVGAVRRRLPRL